MTKHFSCAAFYTVTQTIWGGCNPLNPPSKSAHDCTEYIACSILFLVNIMPYMLYEHQNCRYSNIHDTDTGQTEYWYRSMFAIVSGLNH